MRFFKDLRILVKRYLQTDVTSVLNLAKRINCLFKFRIDFMKPVSLENDVNKSVNRFFEINSNSIDFEKI